MVICRYNFGLVWKPAIRDDLILVRSFALFLLSKTLQSSAAAYGEIQPACGLAGTEMPVDIRWELTDLLNPCKILILYEYEDTKQTAEIWDSG